MARLALAVYVLVLVARASGAGRRFNVTGLFVPVLRVLTRVAPVGSGCQGFHLGVKLALTAGNTVLAETVKAPLLAGLG